MKKLIWLTALTLTLALLAGCGGPIYGSSACSGGPDDPAAPSAGQTGGLPSPEGDEEPVVITLRIVDGAEDGFLVLAGEGAGSVYTLSVGEAPVTLVTPKGEQSGGGELLADGMMVDVAFSGRIAESYPAQLEDVYSLTAYGIGTEQTPAGGYYDLCGLYLQVLGNLWECDPGLNSGITDLALDLSQAPGGLTEGEKSALTWCFGNAHGMMAMQATFQELLEWGRVTPVDLGPEVEEGPVLYQWEDGILFSITAADASEGERYSLPTLFFNAEKWRAPLGAYFLSGCSATWPESGTWSSYKIGEGVIS